MSPSRLLIIHVLNPIPGTVKLDLIKDLGTAQATLIYRASLRCLIKQLAGLNDTALWISYPSSRDKEPIRQWLYELFSESPHWSNFSLSFHLQSDPLSLLPKALSSFQKVALIGTDCVALSSRWIHATFSQLNEHQFFAQGLSTNGSTPYLRAYHRSPFLKLQAPQQSVVSLPPLPVIHTARDWELALLSPLGAYLKKSYQLLQS